MTVTSAPIGSAAPPPAPPAVGAAFGGGPFWRKYGYDSAYDAIREQTLSTTGPARSEPPAPPPFVAKPIDWHFIENRAFGSVAADMRAFWEAERRDRLEADEDEIMTILLLME